MSALLRKKHLPLPPGERCPLCESADVEPRLGVGEFSIVRCGDCSARYAWPRPAAAELPGIYTAPEYFGGANFYLDYLGHEANHRRLAQRVLRQLRRFHRPPARLLDVGSAAGFFLDEARRQGYSVRGVELSPSMSSHARNTLGLRIETAAFDTGTLGEERFDLLTFLDSIEHFRDPGRALERAHTLLAPGGVVALLTPNVDSALARIMRARWPHYTPPEHLYYFNAASLRRLLGRVGFEPLELRTLGHDFSGDELLEKLAPRLRQRARRLGLGRVLARSIYLNVGDLFVVAKKR